MEQIIFITQSYIRGHNGMYHEKDDQDTDLIISAAHGDHERMNKVLESGCDINGQNSKGYSAIHIASQMGSIECAKILIENNADVNIRTIYGDTPLMVTAWYVCGNDLAVASQILNMLISAGAHLNAMNNHGVSALYLAVSNDEPVLVRQLLLAGANVNVQDADGQTPLILAAQNAAVACLDLLLEFEGDVHITDNNNDTALITAVVFDYYEVGVWDNEGNRVQCCKKLIQKGIDVNASNIQHETALFFVSHQSATQYTVTMLKMLLRAGVEMNSVAAHTDLNCIKACYEANHIRDDTDDYFTFLQLLFIAGEKCEVAHKNDVDKAFLSCQQVVSDGSLFDLCRTEIRSILVQRQRKNLFETVPMLPFPKSIIMALLYNNEL